MQQCSGCSRDFGGYTYPLAAHLRESILNGEWPLWNPYARCGLPFLAQWNTLALYPPSLFYIFLPLPWSLNLFSLGHQFIAGLGMYFLARHWTNHQLAAAVAGIGFAFSGFMESALCWSCIMAALGWMPWVVLLAERAWVNGGRAVVLAAGVGALQMLSGAPEVILLTWLIVGCLWLAQCLAARRRPWVTLARLATVGLLTAGLAAVQLIPFLDLLGHSYRTATGVHDQWWVPWWGLANLVVPMFRVERLTCGIVLPAKQSWLPSFYPGIGLLALGLWGALTVRGWRARCLAILGLLSLWLALGDPGWLLPGLRRLFPILKLVRYPVKYLILGAFVWPLLAGLAVDHWSRPKLRRAQARTGLWLLGAFVLLIAGVIFVGFSSKDALDAHRTWTSGASRALFLLAMATLVGWALPRLSERRLFWCGLGLLLLHWSDVQTHSPPSNPTTTPSVFASPGPAAQEMKPPPKMGQARAMQSPEVLDGLDKKTLPDIGQTYLVHRLGLYANCNLLDHIPVVDGWFPLMLATEQQLYPCWFGPQGTPKATWADFLGVSEVMLPDGTLAWRHRSSARPLVTAGQNPVFLDDAQALAFLGSEQFDSSRDVVLPLAARSLVAGVDGKGTPVIHMVDFTAHQITFFVESGAPSVGVIAQSYYHYWRAEVDGTPVPLWRANYDFQAVVLPAGSHHVRLKYVDRGFKSGALITLLSLVVGILWWKFSPRGATKDN